MRALLPFVSALCLVAWGCRSQETLTEAEQAEQSHREAWLEQEGASETQALPSDWLEGSARDFTRAVDSWNLPSDLLWNKAGHIKLAQVLLQPCETPSDAEIAVRAALLLARDSSPPSKTSLLTRLERRMAPPERGRQAAGIVCAAALSKHEALDAGTMDSLRRLAIGRIPHPDLDVRVECARAYLAHIPCSPGEKIPLRARACLRFLIKVLRAETPAQAADPITWPRVRTVAWPKGRAAQELCRWHPTTVEFRPDGPWQDQVVWARLVEQALEL